jgi:hypothetical protein
MTPLNYLARGDAATTVAAFLLIGSYRKSLPGLHECIELILLFFFF